MCLRKAKNVDFRCPLYHDGHGGEATVTVDSSCLNSAISLQTQPSVKAEYLAGFISGLLQIYFLSHFLFSLYD